MCFKTDVLELATLQYTFENQFYFPWKRKGQNSDAKQMLKNSWCDHSCMKMRL